MHKHTPDACEILYGQYSVMSPLERTKLVAA